MKVITIHSIMKKQVLGLSLVAVLAFAVRFPIAFKVFGSADMVTWELVAKLLSQHRNPYMEFPYFPHPPLGMTILYATNLISSLIQLPFYVVTKVWWILSDVATTVLVYLIAKRNNSSTKGLVLALLFALHPVSILVTSVHGSFDPLVTMFVVASVYCLLDSDQHVSVLTSGLFLGLSVFGKIWPLFLLPAFLTQIVGWKNRLEFTLASVLPTVCGLGPMYVINPERVWMSVQASALPCWWGFTGFTLWYSGSIYVTTVSDLLIEYGRYLILLLPWLMFLKKSTTWTLVDKVVTSLLSFYVLTPGFAPQYLVWIIPFGILSKKKIFALWAVYASACLLLDYGFNTALGQFVLALSGSRFPVLEGFVNNQYNIVLLRLPLWILFLIWLRNILFPLGKKYDNSVCSGKPRIDGAEITRRRVRKPKLLVCALILAILVGYYVTVLYPGGKSLIEHSLSDIEGASRDAKPMIIMSTPVRDWEVRLYERHLTFEELGAELGNHWGASASIQDVYAWIGRMRIYTNTLDVFGYQAYIPVPIQFKVAWESFGEEGLLLVMAIYAIYRETKLDDLRRTYSLLWPSIFLALYVVTVFTTRLHSDFEGSSIALVALSLELVALAIALAFPAIHFLSARIRNRLWAKRLVENRPL